VYSRRNWNLAENKNIKLEQNVTDWSNSRHISRNPYRVFVISGKKTVLYKCITSAMFETIRDSRSAR